jgi:ParB/RepB/Spo0J family partition protein
MNRESPAFRRGECQVVVTGERRWRAAVAAGLPVVAALLLDSAPTDRETRRLELQVTENALREGLPAVDQARAFRALSDRNGWSARQVAESLQVHYSTVTRSLALLNLPGPLFDLVEAGSLSPRTALELVKVGDPDAQVALADQVVGAGLTLTQTAALVRGPVTPAPGSTPPLTAPDAGSVRVFTTPAGRVTVETHSPGGGLDAVLIAVLEVVETLKAARAAQNRERSGCLLPD